MKSPRKLSLLALAVLGVGFALAPREDGLAFKVDQGVEIAKNLRIEGDFRLDDFSLSMGGQEMPVGDEMDALGVSFEMQIGVSDVYVELGEGMPLQLLRTFEELSLEYESPEEGGELEEFGALAGSTVQFLWDEEEGEHLASFHEEDGDEELIDGLIEDMDLRALLPEGSVAEGESWTVAGNDLVGVFLPGGMVGLEDEEEGGELDDAITEQLEAQLAEAFEDFELSCTFKGRSEVDGVEVGEIQFEADGEVSIDITDVLTQVLEMNAEDMPFEADVSGDLNFDFEGGGVLLWNLSGGHAHSFEMNNEVGLLFEVYVNASTEDGQSFELDIVAEASGQGSWSLDTEVR